MIDLKDVVKKERAKVQIKAPAAGEPGNGKTSAELEKEILENHKAMLESAAKESRVKAAIEAKAAKESAAKSDLIEHETKPIKESELEVHTTKPIIPTHMDCPFCGLEKSIKGMNRHIAAKHEVPGVTIQDLDDVEKGLKSLEDLVTEKFPEGEAEIFSLSPEVEKKGFPDWIDIEPEQGPGEDPEDQEDPEDLAGPKGQEDPGKEVKENGAGGLFPIFLFIGGGLTIAAIILSRIPKTKEISDKLFAFVGGLGSKKFSDPTKSSGINISNWPHRRF